MKKKFKRDIGKRLRQAREALGLSQTRMAADLLVSRSTYSMNEIGDYPPTAGLLHNLYKDKGVSPAWLLSGEGRMFVSRSQWNEEAMEFLSGNLEVEELLVLMKKIPLLKYKMMQEFNQFKQDNPQQVAGALTPSLAQ
ncbi:MAG: helix-turn-helix transcriptional regulator [bacterium]|nr:helix-turn-helix transcriptional regulator [bacterium]